MRNSKLESMEPRKEKHRRLIIDRAKYSDMAAITKIISSSAEWYEPFLDPKDLGEHRPDEEWIARNYFRRDFFVARCASGRPIGTVSVQNLNGCAYLGYIYVHADHTGNGIGKILMDHAREVAVARDFKAMALIAHPQAKWATKAYKRFGFKIKAKSKGNVLAWNSGALKPYYEEGFHLYYYPLK